MKFLMKNSICAMLLYLDTFLTDLKFSDSDETLCLPELKSKFFVILGREVPRTSPSQTSK